MAVSTTLIDMADCTALLLWGTPIVQSGIQRAFGGHVELMAMLTRVRASLGRAASLFMVGDVRLACLIAEEKAAFRDLEASATRGHFERLRLGRLDSAETSALHIDALRDLQRINSHLIAGAAYPVPEREGGLLPSRLPVTDL